MQDALRGSDELEEVRSQINALGRTSEEREAADRETLFGQQAEHVVAALP